MQGAFCELPADCPGVMDVDGFCCHSGMTDGSGHCCVAGHVTDIAGTCCSSERLDACGMCDGLGTNVDVRGVCCLAPGKLDAAGERGSLVMVVAYTISMNFKFWDLRNKSENYA